jgi:hypothetical protein
MQHLLSSVRRRRMMGVGSHSDHDEERRGVVVVVA